MGKKMVSLCRENRGFILIWALLVANCLKYCIKGEVLAYTNSLLSVAVFGGYAFFLFFIKKKQLWDVLMPFMKGSFFLMLLLAATMVFGAQLDTHGYVNFEMWYIYPAIVILAAGWSPICAFLMHCLEEVKIEYQSKENNIDKGYFFKIWVLLFLAYVFTLLGSWPGFFTYDAEAELYMVNTDKYSTYQPLTHVVLLGWVIRIVNRIAGSYNAGIVVYLLMQIVVVSGCFAYMLNFLKKCEVRRWIRNVGIIFLAFFPTVSMFVCCTTKDVYFSGGIALFTTLLLEFAREGKRFWQQKGKSVLLVFASLLILLFRNNGIYAYALCAIVCFVVYRKEWKRWVLVFGSAILTFFVMTNALVLIFNAKKGPMAEMFCVPIQQLARVHEEAKDNFSEEDKEVLYNLIPESILEKYNPKLTDPVKANFLEDNFKKEPWKYISLWAKMGLKYPDVYVNAFLINTYGYWYPDTVLDGYTGIYTGGRQYGESSYFAFVTETPGIRKSVLPWLEGFYEKVSLEIYQQKIPVISMLFSIGFWFWVYLFMMFFLWKNRCKKQMAAFSMIAFTFLTVLLGPIALVRYVLYLFFCVPLVLALLFDYRAMVEKNID